MAPSPSSMAQAQDDILKSGWMIMDGRLWSGTVRRRTHAQHETKNMSATHTTPFNQRTLTHHRQTTTLYPKRLATHNRTCWLYIYRCTRLETKSVFGCWMHRGGYAPDNSAQHRWSASLQPEVHKDGALQYHQHHQPCSGVRHQQQHRGPLDVLPRSDVLDF